MVESQNMIMLGIELRPVAMSIAYCVAAEEAKIKIAKLGKNNDLASILLYNEDIERPLVGDQEVTQERLK